MGEALIRRGFNIDAEKFLVASATAMPNWSRNYNLLGLSLERRMKCGVGKCGHCVIDHLYTCIDGPVFAYWDTLHFRELI
jgi:hypothetical protein